MNAHIIFNAFAEINCNQIALIFSFQCTIISEMTLNMTLHCSIFNNILKHFLPYDC